MFVSVFSALLGSIMDTCTAFVYEASAVSVDGRLSSGNGFSDVMDYEQFWRR